MAAFTSPTSFECLAQERDDLVAWLAREFAHSLTIEDAEDIVSEALPALATDPRLPAGGRRRRSYLRRALRRDALDELRHRHGRDLREGPRELLPLDCAGEIPDPGVPPGQRLEDAQLSDHHRAAVERTMTRLEPSDAELLRLRYLEQRAPAEIAGDLGLSRNQYERRLAQAGAHGLAALSRAESSATCGPVRRLLRAGRLETRDDIARVDVHLLDCLHCRAFAARARGLLEIAGLPVVAACERIAARVGSLFGRGGDAAMREAHDAAVAGGTAVGAGTALTVGLGTKVAVSCAGVALAAVCAGPLVSEFAPRSDRSTKASAASASPHRKASKPRAAKATTTPTPFVATSTPTPTVTRAVTPKSNKKSSERRLSRRERERRNAAAAAREFGPDAATPSLEGSGGARASAASSGGSSTVPPPPPPPKPASRPQGPKSSSFSGEFRP